jgi:ParB-like chromosome segregation protein Spo0J
MTEIQNVKISSIDSNPMRKLAEYQFIERKLEALQRSYKEVGIWPGIIARKKGAHYQLAFGHHRVEAAKRAKHAELPLIVRELSDKEMIQYLGRENLEDYNADFLIMLETWQAAIEFSRAGIPRASSEPLEIARLLGWTSARSEERRGTDELNDTAKACHSANALIIGGHVAKDDLRDMTVAAAKALCGRAHSHIEHIDKMAAEQKIPARDATAAKKRVGKATRFVAKDYRAENIGIKDLRGSVDKHTYREDVKAGRGSPLFAAFAKSLANSIHKMLTDDQAAAQLYEMEQNLDNLELEEDKAALRKVDFALAEHEIATGNWRKRLAPSGKVIPLRLLKKEA